MIETFYYYFYLLMPYIIFTVWLLVCIYIVIKIYDNDKDLFMKKEKVYLVGTHPYAFRSGQPALVIGLKSITPDGSEPRLCYEVQYIDEKIDHVPVEDTTKYCLLSESELNKYTCK